MTFDYQIIGNLIGQVVSQALPIRNYILFS